MASEERARLETSGTESSVTSEAPAGSAATIFAPNPSPSRAEPDRSPGTDSEWEEVSREVEKDAALGGDETGTGAKDAGSEREEGSEGGYKSGEEDGGDGADDDEEETAPIPVPPPPGQYPTPTYVWINNDDSKETGDLFRKAVPGGRDPNIWFEELSVGVVEMLYPTVKYARFPGPRQAVMLFTDNMDGIAYTTSNDDGTQSEIHLSTRYLRDILKRSGLDGLRSECHGVLVHELVHVWQHSTLNNLPGGLIEGLADLVRLRHRLSPPHWREGRSDNWLAGYQTTGFFLDWIEKRHPGFVERLNAYCGSEGEWNQDCIWWLAGKSVGELWDEYQASLPKDAEEGETVPTHAAEPTPTAAVDAKGSSETELAEEASGRKD
ncbi:peptidase of plants and bacteria-domain-containing protein [Hyaloraphidium curvatum]|nr:peptidase of plants and bacteria-domain-containing protein [Hyaloraphidium curvatum]